MSKIQESENIVDSILHPDSKRINEGFGKVDNIINTILNEEDLKYKAYFKTMLDKEGVKSINSLSKEEKKAFFNKVDKGYKAKSE